MNFKTFNYQRNAIERFSKKSLEFLSEQKKENNFKKIIFQSPTGSGKTVMMSKIIENIAFNDENKVSFIWVSKGILAEQSKKSFEKYIGGGGLIFSGLEDILDNEIKENEVLFTNWEKIFSKAGKDNPDKEITKGDWTNKFMRENERDCNLKTFCQNTINKGRKIILIIDESHLNITENTIKIMQEIINPYLRIDVTATPKTEQYAYGNRDGEFILLEDVKDEEVIKKEIIINANITKKDLKTEKSGDEIIFQKAIEKRNELLELYKKENSKVKPLILIQLPNTAEKLSVTDEQKITWVEKILKEKYQASYENKKVAKWLSGDKSETVEKISDFDSPVEFLIFKQAIATGWDCPRSQILIKFRQTRSEIFEIQTFGRIMRSPEFKHYREEKLNIAYVFANLNEIEIDKNALNYIKTHNIKRKKEYKDINLYSVYLKRGEYNDLKTDYHKYFFEAFLKKIGGKYKLGHSQFNFKKFKEYKNSNKTKINLDIENIEDIIISNEKIKDIDKKRIIKGKKENKVKLSNFDITKIFNNFLKENTRDYQKARSYLAIRKPIYDIFEKYLEIGIKTPFFAGNIDKMNKIDFQKIVLKNKGFFIEVIETSIKKYSDYREKTKKEIEENQNWNVPKEDNYSDNYIENKTHKKCIMEKSFYSDIWKTETSFIENYLETDKKIDWWYKNGDTKNKIYLGIKFLDNKTEATFYPDFIVKYKDGRIGIFDTKMGGTAKNEDTKLKADALSKYIKELNKKGKKLFGGIMIPSNDKYEDFKLNQNLEDNYNYEKGNWEVWK